MSAGRIYRIARREDWEAALAGGVFASPDLAQEGFIHFSERHQLPGTAARHYRGRSGLCLLEVEEAQVRVPVRRENTSGGTELFPHVYGGVPRAAVVRWWPLAVDDTGRAGWPPDL
ncbi:MAG: DUF952 domain-containing protein [Verrucomicrobiota bacterium]